MRLRSVGVRAASLTLVFLLLAEASAQRSEASLAGAWDSRFGTVDLQINGNAVTGTYAGSGAAPAGVLKGNSRPDGSLALSWQHKSASGKPDGPRGTVVFSRVAGSPERLSGSFTTADGKTSGNWDLARPAPVGAATAPGIAGRWSSDFGDVTLNVIGTRVTGTYTGGGGVPAGSLEGTHQNGSVTARWTHSNGSERGSVTWQPVAGTPNQMTGTWRTASGSNPGSWKLWRDPQPAQPAQPNPRGPAAPPAAPAAAGSIECTFVDVLDPVFVGGAPDESKRSSTTILEWSYSNPGGVIPKLTFRWDIPDTLVLRHGANAGSFLLGSTSPFVPGDLKFSTTSRNGINYQVVEITTARALRAGESGKISIHVKAAKPGAAVTVGLFQQPGQASWHQVPCSTTVKP